MMENELYQYTDIDITSSSPITSLIIPLTYKEQKKMLCITISVIYSRCMLSDALLQSDIQNTYFKHLNLLF